MIGVFLGMSTLMTDEEYREYTKTFDIGNYRMFPYTLYDGTLQVVKSQYTSEKTLQIINFHAQSTRLYLNGKISWESWQMKIRDLQENYPLLDYKKLNGNVMQHMKTHTSDYLIVPKYWLIDGEITENEDYVERGKYAR